MGYLRRPLEKLTAVTDEGIDLKCSKQQFKANLISIWPSICGDYKNTVPKLPVASQECGLQADTCMPASIWSDILDWGRVPGGVEIDQGKKT